MQHLNALGCRSCERSPASTHWRCVDARIRMGLTQHELARVIDVAGGERIRAEPGSLPHGPKCSTVSPRHLTSM